MKRFILYMLMPAMLLSLNSCMVSKNDPVRVAMKKNKETVPKKLRCDAKFAVCAADASRLQTRLGEYASGKASDASVKKFGQTMQQAHSSDVGELKALAAKQSIVLPEAQSEMSEKFYTMLSKKEGEKFDRSYMKCMVKAHKKMLCKYKKEVKKGKDPALKAWADSKMPELKKHKELAKTTCKELKKK
jgi:putative membrane protein